MKLWQKIFGCMFLLAFLSTILYGGLTVKKSHRENLDREMARSVGEMDLLYEAMDKAADTMGSWKEAVSWYGDYYRGKGLFFALYEEDKLVYNNQSQVTEGTYCTMLQVKEGQKQLYVKRAKEDAYMITAKAVPQGVLFYLRSIQEVYRTRQENLRILLLWLLALAVLMAGAAFGAARLLTRPLERLKKDVECMENGDYTVGFTEGKDEIGALGSAFHVLARTVQAREEALKEEARKKQQFIDALTHEMNTPLTCVQGYARFLLNANCSQEQGRKALEAIESEARRMSSMYEALKTLLLMKTDGIRKRETDLQEVVQAVLTELESALLDKNIQVTQEYQIKSMDTDPDLLHILLSNLLRNGINYSKEAGTAALCFFRNRQGEEGFFVQDWGCGIPKEYVEKVTEPFCRVDKSRSRQTGGCGIGLYLCREIVQALGGTLEIVSEEGNGTLVKAVFTNVKQDGNVQERLLD